MYTITAVLRKERADIHGRCPILMRITISRSSIYHSTGIRIHPSHWDPKAQRATRAAKNWHLINTSIKNASTELERLILERKVAGHAITPSWIRSQLRAEKSPTMLHTWAERHLAINRHLKPSTVRQYRSELAKLERYHPGGILLSEISQLWIGRYEEWMVSQGNQINTVWKSLKVLRALLLGAKKDGLIRVSPFDGYKLRYINPLPKYLSTQELDKIWSFSQGSQEVPLRVAALYLLLSAYTGLRYSDCARIQGGGLEKDGRLILATHKNGEIVSIKIGERVRSILDQLDGHRLISNAAINRHLKVIGRICGVDGLSFHAGRHSFATTAAGLGISREVVQKILGHKSVKTTDIYYSITSSQIDQELSKMG